MLQPRDPCSIRSTPATSTASFFVPGPTAPVGEPEPVSGARWRHERPGRPRRARRQTPVRVSRPRAAPLVLFAAALSALDFPLATNRMRSRGHARGQAVAARPPNSRPRAAPLVLFAALAPRWLGARAAPTK